MDSSRSHLIPLPPDVIARADPALLALLALQQARIEFLEARNEELLAQLGKNSSNSDKPPSSDGPFREKKAPCAPKLPRKYHKGARQAFMEPTQIYQLMPECCPCGCSQLSEPQCYYVHQYWEACAPSGTGIGQPVDFSGGKGSGATNNRAERTLRFAVTWRKRCFGSRNDKGERFVERVLSLRQTCRLRGLRTWPILVDACAAFLSRTRPELVNQIAQPP